MSLEDISEEVSKARDSSMSGHRGAAAEGKGETIQFLSFAVGEEQYCVDIMMVREIKGWAATTRLPNAPDYMRGVINLRGAIIPIFDLRARFEMGATEATEKHVIIILAVGDRLSGILVDAVSDILTVQSDDIKPAPAMQLEIDDAYVSGLISVDERMVVLLNVENLFQEELLEQAEKLAS